MSDFQDYAPTWLFFFNAPAPQAALDIPGVHAMKSKPGLRCADHAAALVEVALRQAGIRFRAMNPPMKQTAPAFTLQDVMTPEALALAKDYQLAFAEYAASRPGVYAQMAAGAGKTLAAFLAAARFPGPIVLITRAAAREQLRAEARRFMRLPPGEPTVVEGAPPEIVPDGKSGSHRICVWEGGLVYTTIAAAAGGKKGEPPRTVELVEEVTAEGFATQPVTFERLGKGAGWRVVRSGLVTHRRPRLTILSWESLRSWGDVLAEWTPAVSIADEAHRAKNPRRFEMAGVDTSGFTFQKKDSQAAQAMHLFRASQRRIALSATPVPNQVEDWWAQLDLVEPYQWGSFGNAKNQVGSFGLRYCDACSTRYTEFDTKGSSNLPELIQRLSFTRFFVPKEYSHRQLPAKRREVVMVKVEDQNDIDEATWQAEQSEPGDHWSAAELLLKRAAAQKRDHVVDMVTAALEAKQKVVVVTGRRVDAHVLFTTIHKAVKGKIQGAVITGEDDVKVRHEAVTEYMAANESAWLVGTMDCLSESLNLQRTDLAIAAMLPLKPGAVIQLEGRFSRLGGDRPVIIRYLIGEKTYDEKHAAILLAKLPAVEATAPDPTLDGLKDQVAYGGQTAAEVEAELAASLLAEGYAEVVT